MLTKIFLVTYQVIGKTYSHNECNGVQFPMQVHEKTTQEMQFALAVHQAEDLIEEKYSPPFGVYIHSVLRMQLDTPKEVKWI